MKGTRVDILERIYRWAVNSSPTSPSVVRLTETALTRASTLTAEQSWPRTFSAHDNSKTRDDGRKYIIPTIVYQLTHRFSSYASVLGWTRKLDSVGVLFKQLKDLLVDPRQQSTNTSSHSKLPPYLAVVNALDEIDDGGGSDFL